jgi:hypothetical protein
MTTRNERKGRVRKAKAQASKQQSRPNVFNCQCPLFVTIPGEEGQPDQTLPFPEKYHRLWHEVTTKDQQMFRNLPPGVTQYWRDYIPDEAWPRKLPNDTKVLVKKFNNGQQARCFIPKERAEVA